MALLAVFVVISAVNAVDLVNDFDNGDFKINVPSGTDFNETVNISVNEMNMIVYENLGKNSHDANSIIYLKDSSADKNEINQFIKDLEKDAKKFEETDKYIVFKNTQNSNDFDIGNSLDGVFNIANDIFSSGGNFNVSADGNSVSFSDKGLEILDANGEGASISSEGINFFGNESSDNVTSDISSGAGSSMEYSDYSVYLKNNNANKVIVISGNNLELLKAMAETASISEN